MANKGEIYIGLYNTTTTMTPQLLSSYGRQFSMGIIQLDRKDRTADNTLRVDIINRKKKITLQYEAIDGDDLAIYETYFAYESKLILYVYTSDIAYDEYTVIMMPFDKTRWILMDSGLWTNVQFVFEEV